MLLALWLPLVALLQTAPPPAAAPDKIAPKLTARLYAAHESVAPGGTVDLAIELTIDKGWHFYHPISLSGGPTTIKFEAPPGVTFGPLQYPAPYLGSLGGIEYLAYDDRAVILTQMTVPADATGEVAVKALVRAMACKELCFPVSATAALTLPVKPGTAAPAHAKLFEDARAALPKPLSAAPYLEGSRIAITPATVTPETAGSIELSLRVKKGHHIQDPDPKNEMLIPSRVFIEALDGLKIGDPQWPEPKIKEIQGYGKVREQVGEFTVRIPVAINDAKFASGPIALRVLLQYQTCTDAGMCFAPELAEGLVQFTAQTPNPAVADASPRGTLFAERGEVRDTAAPGLAAAPEPGPAPAPTAGARAAPPPGNSFLQMLLAAFLGGLLLNVMPCVFPVISIKVIGFVQQAGEDRARVLKLGLAFCAGIMVWFWLFAVLTSLGRIPWQHPPVMIGLAGFLFLFALNLFGVFEIILPGAAAGRLDAVASREGYWGSFLKGLLATLLGTACTAPFFAAAAAYAATQPASVSFAVFTSAGVGMSAPYLVLSAFPQWLKVLPRPGPWMVTFKQAMGFVLAATTVWLLAIVGDLLDASGLVWTLVFFLFLAAAAWLLGKINFNWSTGGRSAAWVAALGLILGGWWFSFGVMYDLNAPRTELTATQDIDELVARVQAADWSEHIPWEPWRPGLPEELSRRGHTVYVDFTATWCVTCQTNKKTAVDIESNRKLMKELGVIPLRADFTKEDPAIRAVLLRFGHNSVPLNLIYPAGKPDSPRQLPVLLTPGIVAENLRAVGGSTPKVAAAPQ